jgi:hypothetical protein
MRLRFGMVLVALTALAGACTTDQPTSPTERRSPAAQDSVIVLAAPAGTCVAVPATIRATIITLFLNAGFGSSSAAVAQFNLILSLLAAGDVEGAERATRLLGATKPASRRLTVDFDPYVTAQFLSVLSAALNGERA